MSRLIHNLAVSFKTSTLHSSCITLIFRIFSFYIYLGSPTYTVLYKFSVVRSFVKSNYLVSQLPCAAIVITRQVAVRYGTGARHSPLLHTSSFLYAISPALYFRTRCDLSSFVFQRKLELQCPARSGTLGLTPAVHPPQCIYFNTHGSLSSYPLKTFERLINRRLISISHW